MLMNLKIKDTYACVSNNLVTTISLVGIMYFVLCTSSYKYILWGLQYEIIELPLINMYYVLQVSVYKYILWASMRSLNSPLLAYSLHTFVAYMLDCVKQHGIEIFLESHHYHPVRTSSSVSFDCIDFLCCQLEFICFDKFLFLFF